ncbi:MAG: metallophosphoesterase family protein [bacterium]|nr:metallophosphoesterase family protein [bacterium]
MGAGDAAARVAPSARDTRAARTHPTAPAIGTAPAELERSGRRRQDGGVGEIGVVSDTHGLVRPELLAALDGVVHVLHAGDVGSAEVLAALGQIAPVTAVRGNNDRGPWAATLPAAITVTLAGVRIHLLHDRKELTAVPDVAVVVAGHSHRPGVAEHDGVLFLNPGSAGPRRFRLPVTMARLALTDGVPAVRIVSLIT